MQGSFINHVHAYLCVSMYMYVHEYTVRTYVFVCMHAEGRGQPRVSFLRRSCTLSLEVGSLTLLEPLCDARLAGQGTL